MIDRKGVAMAPLRKRVRNRMKTKKMNEAADFAELRGLRARNERPGGGGRKCGKQRTCGRGFLEVWQRKDLAVDFADVWQTHDLALG